MIALTGEEWLEMVAWVDARFTPGWNVDQAAAYGSDLRDHNAEDVWDAIYRLYDQGLEYPPNGSQIKAKTTEVVRDRIERARREAAGLPPSTETEDKSWEHWAPALGYDGKTIAEAIIARHRELFPRGCPYEGCDACGNVVAA